MKIGIVQTHPIFGDIVRNLHTIEALINRQPADLYVLPELCTTGYQFKDREEALGLAESIPDGPSTLKFLEIAQTTQTFIVAGLAERCGDRVYNSAILVGPEGFIGCYRKVHLFGAEKNCFSPGDSPFPVYDLGPVRVGVMICFDWRFPESMRSLALEGADIVAHPSNLVLPDCPQSMITRCLENRVFAITADRVGAEERVPGQTMKFIGQSQAIDPSGKILARASTDKEEILVVEINPQEARNKSINPQNNLFADRRVDLYRRD